MITNIQRFSLHDGPGIRTTVFFKGCNLRCYWCHNPETLSSKPQLQFFAQKCIGCGLCSQICSCHSLENGLHKIHRENCVGCGRCVESCFSGSLVLAGIEKTAQEIFEEVIKDKEFYASSGGGVTVSGGEPLLQPELCRDLLRLCKKAGIHTAVDTAFHVEREAIDKVFPYTDLFLIDIKHWDRNKHKEYTGVTNERILENICYIDAKRVPFIIRIPVLPESQERQGAQCKIVDIIQRLKNVQYVELLAVHKLGIGKYQSLDMDYNLIDITDSSLAEMADYFEKKLEIPVKWKKN